MVSMRDPWYFSCKGSCSIGEMLVEPKEILVSCFIIFSRRCVFCEEEEEAIKSLISSSSFYLLWLGIDLWIGPDGIPLLHHFLLFQPKVVFLNLCWVW
jgi:hypothetical protein